MKNIEIKARCRNPQKVQEILESEGARFVGTDTQIDTYFKVSSGRLKWREGKIENALIAYDRKDHAGVRQSHFSLYHSSDANTLKSILTNSLGIKVVVNKKRKIFFIGHIKFHIDEVAGLGHFVEIEVTDMAGKRESTEMHTSCRHYMDLLGICEKDCLATSYSDMLLERESLNVGS